MGPCDDHRARRSIEDFQRLRPAWEAIYQGDPEAQTIKPPETMTALYQVMESVAGSDTARTLIDALNGVTA